MRTSFWPTGKRQHKQDLLDENLKKSGIAADSVSGYKKEMVSDLSTAEAVISGRADIAVGGDNIRRTVGTSGFSSHGEAPHVSCHGKETLQKPDFLSLRTLYGPMNFRTSLRSQSGYDTGRTGEMLYL